MAGPENYFSVLIKKHKTCLPTSSNLFRFTKCFEILYLLYNKIMHLYSFIWYFGVFRSPNIV